MSVVYPRFVISVVVTYYDACLPRIFLESKRVLSESVLDRCDVVFSFLILKFNKSWRKKLPWKGFGSPWEHRNGNNRWNTAKVKYLSCACYYVHNVMGLVTKRQGISCWLLWLSNNGLKCNFSCSILIFILLVCTFMILRNMIDLSYSIFKPKLVRLRGELLHTSETSHEVN